MEVEVVYILMKCHDYSALQRHNGVPSYRGQHMYIDQIIIQIVPGIGAAPKLDPISKRDAIFTLI